LIVATLLAVRPNGRRIMYQAMRPANQMASQVIRPVMVFADEHAALQVGLESLWILAQTATM
jgi:hypothetical protein